MYECNGLFLGQHVLRSYCSRYRKRREAVPATAIARRRIRIGSVGNDRPSTFVEGIVARSIAASGA